MEYRILAFVLLSIVLTSCSTVQNTPILDSGGFVNNEEVGILVVSAGRLETKWIGGFPFVDYHIYRLNSEQEIETERYDTIKGEVVTLKDMTGQLGKGKYGWIHVLELQAGDYILQGLEAGRLPFSTTTGGTYIYFPGTESEVLNMAFKVTIKPGVLNYAGELLTVEDPRDTGDISVSDQSQRDITKSYKLKKELKNLPVVISLAVPYERSEQGTEEGI